MSTITYLFVGVGGGGCNKMGGGGIENQSIQRLKQRIITGSLEK